jgi:hypothetical protein
MQATEIIDRSYSRDEIVRVRPATRDGVWSLIADLYAASADDADSVTLDDRVDIWGRAGGRDWRAHLFFPTVGG